MDAPGRKRVQQRSQHHNIQKRQDDSSSSEFDEGYVPNTDILPVRPYLRSSPPIAHAHTHILSRLSDDGNPIYTVRIEPDASGHGAPKTVRVELGAILQFVSAAELDRFEFDLFLHPEKDLDARKPPPESPELPAPKPRGKPGRPRKHKAPSVSSLDDVVATVEGRLTAPLAPMLRKPRSDTGTEDISRGTDEPSVELGSHLQVQRKIQTSDSEDELGLYRAGGAGSRPISPAKGVNRLAAVVLPSPRKPLRSSAAPPGRASRPVTNGSAARRPLTRTASPKKRQKRSHQLDGSDSSPIPTIASFMSRHDHSPPQALKHAALPVRSPCSASPSSSEVDLIPTSPRQPPDGDAHRAPSRQIIESPSLFLTPEPVVTQIKRETSAHPTFSVSLSPSPPPRKNRSRSSPASSRPSIQPESVFVKTEREAPSQSPSPVLSLPAGPPAVPSSEPNNTIRAASASVSASDEEEGEEDSDEEVYEIEAILRDKPFIGKRWYKVKWAGCPIGPDLDDWVTEDMLSGAKELLQDYKEVRQTVMSKDGPVGFLPGHRRALIGKDGK